MRNRLLSRRGSEEVSPGIAAAVFLAILALVATSLMFPWSASAQEQSTWTTTPSATATSSVPDERATATSARTPSPEPATSGTVSPPRTSSSTTQARTSTSAPTSSQTVQAPQARTGPARVQPFALNPGIDVQITGIYKERANDDDPLDPDTALEVGDFVEVHGTWDARNANPAPGDEFSIAFPDELQLTDTLAFSLGGSDGTIWGSCTVNVPSNVMTCVLSDAVEDRDQEVQGTFFVYSEAVERTTSKTVNFTINGETTVPGVLPGDGGIGDGQTIGDATKSGAFTPDKTAIRWTIDIPGSDLAALDDDNTGSVTLSDDLSANMQLCEDGRLNATLLAGRPNDLRPVSDGVTVTQDGGAGNPVSIEITNGTAFDEDLIYRIQYTSCTASGKVDIPAEGEDPIEYSNTVTIGDSTVGGVGIGQDWRPETAPRKWGSFVNGSRYSQLTWTVQVPGTVFTASATNTVQIDETLTGDHVVCDTGLNLSIRQVDHLPGPGGGNPASRDVTDQFTIADSSDAGDTSFSLTLTPIDSAAFDPEKYYRVTYRTCVTTDVVSDTGDRFSNRAEVNGTVAATTVTGPAYTGAKTGSYNLQPTIVAGQEQPAGTTIDWALQIPGYDLEGLDENAVITDTFSDTLTVCEVGDDIKANLNLSVIARDFLGDAAVNEERDLTEDTEVVRTAEGLQFVLPMDDGDYNRETRYFIDYTLCTSSGGVDSRGTTYSNTAQWAGKEISRSVEQRSGGGGTGQGVSRGSFSLQKSIHPFSEEFSIDDTVFTVRVEEFAPGIDPATGTAEDTYTVEVKADGTPVSGVNVRGAGWTIRLTEINLPNGNGVYFEPGVFLPAAGVQLSPDRTQALVTIQPQTNVAVELQNRARLGTATITKTVTGNATSELTGNEKFVIQANISTGANAGTELREFTLKDGQSYNLGNLPIGTTVTFNEVLPANTDRITWGEPVFEPETLIIGGDSASNAVTVTNEASITQGSFEISKLLQGPERYNPAVPENFEVIATWIDVNGAPQQETLTLPADGSPVAFPVELPGGTEVTLTEIVPEDGNGLTWGVPSYSGDVTINGQSGVVTIGQDTAKVEVRNFVDTRDGTLRLTKQVAGEAAESVGDAEFTVKASWQEGDSFRTKELTVRDGQSTPLGVDLPVGTQVTFTEIGVPEIAGIDWGVPTWGTSPAGDSWLTSNPEGTATGIVSDDPTDGRLITLTNEAQPMNGSVGFEKFLFNGEDPVPAIESDLPDGTEFRVRIDGIDPALPAGTDFPGVGYTITLNSDNGWKWHSGDVLPTGTVITFSEVTPAPLDGTDWARPFYYVASDAGEPEDRNTVEIASGERAEVEIRNRPIPTADVMIEKFVTGSKGDEVTADRSSTFEVTATWTDPDNEERSCVLVVRPNGTMAATAQCDAVVVGDRVQFPLDTEITFIETASDTGVNNVSWGDVSWTVADGSADIDEIDGEPAGVVVTLTGDSDERVTLELTNEANLSQGTFGISKQLRGPEQYNNAIPESFEVLATWTDADGNPRAETLQVPSDGSEVQFPGQLPGGTEVTVTEVVPADGNGLAWSVPSYSGDVTINDTGSAVVTIDQEDIQVVVRNYVDTNNGTLRLTKQLSGEAAGAIGDDAEFMVEARWREGTGYGTTQLAIREGQSTPLGVDLPVGTEVTFTEIGQPEIAGVEWTGISWGTNPAGDSWLISNRDGTATGIVSDDPNDGRLITLTNEASWLNGSVSFEKTILDGEDPVPASEAGLPDDAEFQVRIDGIEPALPTGTDFPAVGETITLNSGNGWSWQSEQVLPRHTVVTFSEVDPAPLDGTDWARPSYYVATDAGEPGVRDTVQIVPGDNAEVEIRNRPIPTTDVQIDKIVTGPKGAQVANHDSTTFQVTATWTDVDDQARSCILDVTPDGSMTPTVECDAVVVGDRVQFPVNTEITFVETGAHTDVPNVNWGEVTWSVTGGAADIEGLTDEPTGVVVTLTDQDDPVTLELENETSSKGLIFIPLPIPLPPFDGGSSTPPGPGNPSGPSKPTKPSTPTDTDSTNQPSTPQKPSKPSTAGTSGHDGAPGKPAPARPSKPGKDSSLAVTGTNAALLGGVALILIAGGTWLTLRTRRTIGDEQ